MSVTRSLWFIALFVVMMFKFSPVAEAANCWNGSPSGLDFGTVTPDKLRQPQPDFRLPVIITTVRSSMSAPV